MPVSAHPHSARQRRYAVAGTGARAAAYVDGLLGDHARYGAIVAWCEPNPARASFYNARLAASGMQEVPTYRPENYEDMIASERVDTVIVTSPDDTHADLTARALDAGARVVLEKPVATTAAGCRQIASALERTGGQLSVTFNYRYAPRNVALKRIVASGVIGTVTAIHFEWMLDTIHGADYFRRWHRDKDRSGGLLIQKASHHFDLVNWWLEDAPQTVFARGALRFYGDAGAGKAASETARPERGTPGEPGGPLPDSPPDPYLLDLTADETSRLLYLEGERHDGYRRDADVFGPGITIEDTMSAMVGYQGGATLTYSLVAYAPWEGYRVSITGTKGRAELEVVERAASPAGPDSAVGSPSQSRPAHRANAPGTNARRAGHRLVVQGLWEEAREVAVDDGDGDHGGGDAAMLDDLFDGTRDDPLAQRAGWRDGLLAVAVGLAANRSMQSGMPVRINELTIGEI
ncbi:Gfo/Idh/MocA family oxidoreductase [Demequina sp. TTPB684]|uniref:Gfo/Idh/MocA family protein n=1 Tax=unclassified Demequina TaxID=2620311 RepID=UPI001CF3D583|nr:Gfo/Idh/MocA family oxidoreductase [Demequina sp. TMPB413]MCB2413368.1 Gfo/Idh/MocA family oxidoreductase [Demequina sp. TTPB684]